MTKRNFILLIIALLIISIIGFVLISSYKKPTTGDTGTGTNFFSDFFPFGKSKTTNPDGTENPADVSGYPSNGNVATENKLKKISNMKVAGYGIFMKERFIDVPVVTPPVVTEDTTVVDTKIKSPEKIIQPTAPATEFVPSLKYVDKATGNIYQTYADKEYEQKVTTNIIPQVHDAYFGNKTESVVMRYLKDGTNTIVSFIGSLPREVLGGDMFESTQMTASFLPENITDLSISPDTTKIFYLFNQKDSAIGITAGANGSQKVQVFSSPYTEWLSNWANNNLITLTTKPSSNVPGFMYGINPNKKDFNKILGNINGLTTLTSPSGKQVLYANNNLALNIYNIDNKESVSVGVKTLPEKCVWSTASTVIYCAVPKYINGGNYPDSWYQGETSFSDEIWKIDGSTGNATNIIDPTSVSGGEEADAIKLSIDDNENYLFYINKATDYLWELKLN